LCSAFFLLVESCFLKCFFFFNILLLSFLQKRETK
jgi:hypothetical protein